MTSLHGGVTTKKLQFTKSVRIIMLAKFNAHTEPIFESLKLSKVHNNFEIC